MVPLLDCRRGKGLDLLIPQGGQDMSLHGRIQRHQSLTAARLVVQQIRVHRILNRHRQFNGTGIAG